MAYTTINKSSAHFDTNLYQANGSGKTISNMDFQPDFVWTKNRDSASYIPALVDAVRGGTKKLFSNNTSAESTDANAVTSFTSDGYVFGSSGSFNYGTDDYVNWCWKANGQGSSNTDGTISSTVSANTTSGFSIVKWTSTDTAGSTMGHGLGAIPKMIITKKLASGSPDYWTTYNSTIGNTKSIFLNDTGAMSGASTSYWNDTSPTSSVFSTGTYFNAGDYIAYCFAEKQGYSKFGSYEGNNNVNGTFIYLGFKPAFLIIKAIDNTRNWIMYDNKRDPINVMDKTLKPNTSDAEYADSAYNTIDFLSNGFKLRGGSSGAGNDTNGAETYIYMAFAEAPLVGSNGVTAKAR